ncbi:MAG: DNA-directed RNA polymerase subunit L [Candidatus Heimdallarchaeum aukensis]|uniref:DNA-directed RNA polymerase subunit Rpo11 n=1 Tax=Candidatus Heimdallarchaeum aukensis TaxID=2876573 RepID=A0A9Y1BJ29_9ARCH|nr:MAG: DNA-directed RNA polymerase subunit L [Candidatus Heimdallarchaeum aukensis]
MEIKILKKEDGYVKLNIRGTDPHTLFNLLRVQLLSDPEVDFAGYWRNESFYESIIFQVRLKDESKDPIEVIKQALDNIREQTEEFIKVSKEKLS